MTDAPKPSAAKTEPVAWLSTDEFGDQSATPNMDTMLDWRRYGRAITPLYTHPQPSLSVGLDREAVARVIDPRLEGSVFDGHFTKDSWMGQALAKADQILALAAPAEGYVLVPEKLVHRAAGLLDCEGYDDTSKQLLACLPAAPTGGTGA